MEIKKSLDCVGLFCPMPIAKIRLELDNLGPGDILEVAADDPGFEKDLREWCRMTGARLLDIKKDGIVIKAYVSKK